MRRTLFCFYIFLVCLFNSYSYEQVSDSSRLVFEINRARALYYSNPDSSLYYSRHVIERSIELNLVGLEAWGHKFKGIYHQLKQQNDSALSEFEIATKLFGQSGNILEQANNQLSKAQMFLQLGRFDESLQSNFAALEVYDSMGDKRYMDRVYNNIGQVYSLTEDHLEALPYFHKSLSINLERGDTTNLLYGYANLVSLHAYLNNKDSVQYYAGLARKLFAKTSIYILEGNIEVAVANTMKSQGEFNKALKGYEKAINAYEKIDAKSGLAHANYNYGVLQDTLGRTSIAKAFYLKAIDYSIQSSMLEIHKLATHKLKFIYSGEGDYRKAFEVSLINDTLNDQFLDQKKQESLTELQVSFDLREKENLINLQNVELERQEATIERDQVLIVGLVVVLCLGITLLLIIRSQMRRKQLLIEKEAEIQVREAEINAVINSQEKERNRFARDLHDGFGQLISVLKLNLSQLNEYSSKDLEKRQEVFKNGESVINEMYTELRNICFDLMPQTLMKKGISAALKELGERINKSTQVACEVLIFDNNKRLYEIEEISLFRITQEWVNNVLKYANADAITIQLTRESNELTLTIEDNGIGFNTDQFYNGKGNGWKNIQTRLNLINGEFDLDSRAGIKGTMVTVNLITQEEIIPANTDKEMTTN